MRRSRRNRNPVSRGQANRRPAGHRRANHRLTTRRPAGRAAASAAVGMLAVCAWLAASAAPAQASAAVGGPLYHHPDHDDLPDTTFVPQSDVIEADQANEAEIGDLPPGAGRIIGSPDPGPEPQHSGDRGGWRQLVLLGALAAAVAAIMARVLVAARRRDRDTATQGTAAET